MHALPSPRTRTEAKHPRGEVRMRHAARGMLERLATFVGSIEGVERALPSPATGSLLVLFDAKVTSSRALFDAIAEVPPSAWPAAHSHSRPAHVEWVKVALTTS